MCLGLVPPAAALTLLWTPLLPAAVLTTAAGWLVELAGGSLLLTRLLKPEPRPQRSQPARRSGRGGGAAPRRPPAPGEGGGARARGMNQTGRRGRSLSDDLPGNRAQVPPANLRRNHRPGTHRPHAEERPRAEQ